MVLHYYHIGAIYVTSFFVTDCMAIKQFGTQLMVQSSHLTQIVTDLSQQMAELNRKQDAILLGRSGGTLRTEESETNMAELFATLTVRNDERFENFNNNIKIKGK